MKQTKNNIFLLKTLVIFTLIEYNNLIQKIQQGKEEKNE